MCKGEEERGRGEKQVELGCKSRGSVGPSGAEMAQRDQVVPSWSKVARPFISTLITDVVQHTGQTNLSNSGLAAETVSEGPSV